MANILDSKPKTEAYAFRYPFQVGHELQRARISQLRIEAERTFEEVYLFLDTNGLVDAAYHAVDRVDADVALDVAVGEIRKLPKVKWSRGEVAKPEMSIDVVAEVTRKHRAEGVQPVMVNGVPHLELIDKEKARVDLLLHERKIAILNLLVVVSPYRRRGDNALYHVMEAIGDQVVGGVAIQFRV